MNTINLENQNQIDDLQIERAISGLTEQQFGELRELLRKQSGSTESGIAESDSDPNVSDPTDPDPVIDLDEMNDLNDFERCIAVIDIWMAGSSDVSLSSEQRHRLMDEFVVGSPDRNLSRKHQSNRRRFRTPASWILASALAAAAACLVLASTVWVSQPKPNGQDVMVSAAELRKQMLDNPPGDMVHWVWSGAGKSRIGKSVFR